MSEEKDKEEQIPRWDVIEKLHDKIDTDISDAYKEDKLSFIEVDFALNNLCNYFILLLHIYL